mmetsp:Transcript_42477/g.128900  ORF Transcript_42477/g.128900 Transcript_42477/m.128900 type:complete len:127 (+) Transcript_42477:292-672(+)
MDPLTCKMIECNAACKFCLLSKTTAHDFLHYFQTILVGGLRSNTSCLLDIVFSAEPGIEDKENYLVNRFSRRPQSLICDTSAKVSTSNFTLLNSVLSSLSTFSFLSAASSSILIVALKEQISDSTD